MDAQKQPQAGNACPSDEQLALLAGGNLPPADIDQLASHLDHCEACQAKLEKLDDVDHDSIDDLVKAGEPLAFIDESHCDRAIEDLDQRSSAGSPVNLSGKLFSAGYASDARQPAAPTIERAGRYELIERLGEGAMGAVYRARHMDYGVDYAVKLVHPKHDTADTGSVGTNAPNLVAFGSGSEETKSLLRRQVLPSPSYSISGSREDLRTARLTIAAS